MRVLKSRFMKSQLEIGLKNWRAKGKPIPSNGSFISMHYISRFDDVLKGRYKNWHVQVDVVNDSRFFKYPRIYVYAWKPRFASGSSYADYQYWAELRNGKAYRI